MDLIGKLYSYLREPQWRLGDRSCVRHGEKTGVVRPPKAAQYGTHRRRPDLEQCGQQVRAPCGEARSHCMDVLGCRSDPLSLMSPS